MKTIQTVDWFSFRGEEGYEIPNTGPKRFELSVISQGVSVVIHENDAETLILHGQGEMRVAVGITGGATIVFTPWENEGLTSVLLPDSRANPEIGWTNNPSIAQIELKPMNTISPEIQAIVDTMQRNAVRRENALRQEFEKKLAKAQTAT